MKYSHYMKYLVQEYSKCEGLWCPYWLAGSLAECSRREVACRNELIGRGRRDPQTRIIIWYDSNKLFHDPKEIVTYVDPTNRAVSMH